MRAWETSAWIALTGTWASAAYGPADAQPYGELRSLALRRAVDYLARLTAP